MVSVLFIALYNHYNTFIVFVWVFLDIQIILNILYLPFNTSAGLFDVPTLFLAKHLYSPDNDTETSWIVNLYSFWLVIDCLIFTFDDSLLITVGAESEPICQYTFSTSGMDVMRHVISTLLPARTLDDELVSLAFGRPELEITDVRLG